MKRLVFLLILLFIPFIVLAEDCDISKITITSMEKSGMEGNTEELSTPTYQDNTIGLIICRKDNKFIVEYSSDIRIISRSYKISKEE